MIIDVIFKTFFSSEVGRYLERFKKMQFSFGSVLVPFSNFLKGRVLEILTKFTEISKITVGCYVIDFVIFYTFFGTWDY